MTLGIVGVGNVGSKIVKVAEAQGMRVLLNDLPREDKEGSTAFCSLEQLAQECDIITFHVPLYKEGKYKTYHLADEAFFQSLQRKPNQHFPWRGYQNRSNIESIEYWTYFGYRH